MSGEFKRHIFLVGMPGSGKSTTGKKLAQKMKLNFTDLDQYLETKLNKKITEIFEQQGESEFRKKESKALQEIITAGKKGILSLGGGAPCNSENLALIKKNGIVIYLEMSPDALRSRLIQKSNTRPLFEGLEEAQLLEKLKILLQQREKYYCEADLTVSGMNVDLDTLKKQILSLLGNSHD